MPRALTIGLLLTVSMAAFEAIAVAAILPATVADIGGLAYYGWVFSAFMLAEIVGITAAGRAADRSGLGRPFAAGVGLFTVGLFGGGLAGSMPLLVAARTVQGLGAGAISALAYAAVARGYDAEAKPRMLALLSTAWVVPGLVGPAVAGIVADHLSWRWVFLGLAPPTVIASALTMPALRRFTGSATAAAAPDRTASAARLAAGAGLALAAFSFQSPVTMLVAFAIAAAVAAPALNRLLPAGTLAARPGLPAAIAVMALLSASFFGAEVFVPLMLTQVRHQSVTVSGLALTAATLAWTVGAWWQERQASRRSRRVLVTVGLLVMVAGIAGTACVLDPSLPPWLATATWGVAGLGIGLAYSTTALVVLESARAGQEGEASAALQLANVLGTAVGTGLGGAVLAQLTARGEAAAFAIALADAVAVVTGAAAIAAALRLRH